MGLAQLRRPLSLRDIGIKNPLATRLSVWPYTTADNAARDVSTGQMSSSGVGGVGS
jgi:hypothetical protein